jgi:hypothetical protein
MTIRSPAQTQANPVRDTGAPTVEIGSHESLEGS